MKKLLFLSLLVGLSVWSGQCCAESFAPEYEYVTYEAPEADDDMAYALPYDNGDEEEVVEELVDVPGDED
jgi:hypothetical protein